MLDALRFRDEMALRPREPARGDRGPARQVVLVEDHPGAGPRTAVGTGGDVARVGALPRDDRLVDLAEPPGGIGQRVEIVWVQTRVLIRAAELVQQRVGLRPRLARSRVAGLLQERRRSRHGCLHAPTDVASRSPPAWRAVSVVLISPGAPEAPPGPHLVLGSAGDLPDRGAHDPHSNAREAGDGQPTAQHCGWDPRRGAARHRALDRRSPGSRARSCSRSPSCSRTSSGGASATRQRSRSARWRPARAVGYRRHGGAGPH